jgi:DHA1 family multidrug resistance protein-like MFS transporter
MDIVDRDLEKAEREASPNRFRSSAEADRYQSVDETGERVERAESIASSSSSSIQRTGPPQASRRLSRLRTQSDDPGILERNATAMSRIETQRTQHSNTVGASVTSRKTTKPLPAFGAGKPYPPPLPEREEYVVEFDGADDPMHAQNWPMKKKLAVAAMLGYTTFIAAFGSSIFSAATRTVAGVFHVSTEVGVLGVSLYVLGFATGPIIWAPFSELQGRRLPLIIGSFGFMIFQFAVATGKDLQTVLICRFWGGFFGACPLTVVAAVFSDMFDNRSRGLAITVFSIMVFSGPLMAPFIGGFINMNKHLGWRWTEYLTGIMAVLAFTLNILFLKETYPPVILVEKAAELRRRTKNWGIHAKQEEIEVDFRELVEKNFSRPLRMLVTEPIVLLLSIYMAFIYGLLYLFLTAYPLVFQGVHHMNSGVGGLPYFGIIVGELFAGVFILIRAPGYNKKLAANGGWPIPEWRCPEIIAGGVSFSLGLFWFGWTGYKESIHWAVPTVSGLLLGFGIMNIFLQSLNYLVDAYLMVSHKHNPPRKYTSLTKMFVVRRLSNSSKHLPPVPLRRRLPPLRNIHVQWHGHQLGLHTAGLRCRHLSARTSVLLFPWRED